MTKVVLNDTASGYKLSKINDNFSTIETAFNDKVLYRDNPDGEPNQMESLLDMNGNRIINLPAPQNANDAARLADIPTEPVPIGTTSALLTTFSPAGRVSSINVQAAIEELSNDIRSDGANAAFAVNGSYVANSIGSRLAYVSYITDAPYNAVADNATNNTAAIQAALDAMEARGGGVVFVPGTTSRFLITSTVYVPSGVTLYGLSVPNITGSIGAQQQFRYTGSGVAFALKDGENDLPSRGFSLINIGVELDTAGATGFRFRRVRDGYIQGCTVNMDADNQIGFHYMGERSGGTYAGVFDVTTVRTRSYCDASHTGAVHYKLSGTIGDGQCNGNTFVGIGAGGSGKFLEVGPSITNSFYGLEMEAPGVNNDFIHCLAGATFNDFYNFYCGDAPVGYTGSILKCDAGAANNTLYTYNAGANVSPEDVILGTDNQALYSLGTKFVSTSSAKGYSVRVQGEANDRVQITGTGVKFGNGSSVPVLISPGYTVESTIYSAALGTFTPNVATGRAKFIRFDTGSSGTLTIAAPTNVSSSSAESLEFFIYNNTAGSINLSWNSEFIKNTSFPTSIASGVRLTLKVRNVVGAWWLTGAVATM